MSIARICCGIVLIAFGSPALAQAPLLNSVFQDHAVLQRDRPIPLWGTADPNADVTLSLAGDAATVRANGAGVWKASLPALPAGGPYTLKAASGGRAQQVEDVLVGDVWLCSGQSNMALQVKRTLDADSEIDGTRDNTIRMLTIPQIASVVPRTALAQTSEWQPASPATVGEFSATCFYFARALQKSIHVPMGLVNASWGGSKIRTWMSEPALRASGFFDRSADILDLYVKDTLSGVAPFGAVWEDWWRHSVPTAPGREPWSPALDVQDWPRAPGLGFWDDWGVPELINRTGMVWYRTAVDLTPAQATHAAALSIGQVDEISAAWVNGIFAGDGSSENQTYKLPPGAMHAGSNVVAVNILNTYKKGGLIGPASIQGVLLDDGTKVPLSGVWHYNLVPQSVEEPPRAPWEPLGGLSIAYNGLISPIEPYGLRGAVWYQGESDTGEPEAYRTLLPGLMRDWRQRFETDLPFLIVQLPNYGMPPTKPVDSGWAKLREAQRASVAADKNAALVVTTDLGEDYDVHPAQQAGGWPAARTGSTTPRVWRECRGEWTGGAICRQGWRPRRGAFCRCAAWAGGVQFGSADRVRTLRLDPEILPVFGCGDFGRPRGPDHSAKIRADPCAVLLGRRTDLHALRRCGATCSSLRFADQKSICRKKSRDAEGSGF